MILVRGVKSTSLEGKEVRMRELDANRLDSGEPFSKSRTDLSGMGKG